MRKNIDMNDVLQSLEEDRCAGTLAKHVSSSRIRYGVDPKGPERLVSMDKKGRTQQVPRKPESQ